MSEIADKIFGPESPAKEGISGHWFNLRLKPDPATGELLNVGVCFRDTQGKAHFRVLTNFDRLRCMYSVEIEEQTRFLLHSVSELANGDWVDVSSISENLLLSDAKPAHGASVNQILTECFKDTVPLGRARRETSHDQAFKSMTTERVRSTVIKAINKRAGIYASDIVPDQASVPVEDGDGTRVLDVPLQGERCFGSIVSAWYRSTQSLEIQIFRAITQVEAAARLRQKKSLGLFVMRPSEHAIPSKELRKIDKKVDELLWRAKAQGFYCGAEESDENLAHEIIDWAKVRAA